MNNSICKIEKEKTTGTGFISIIPFPDKFNQLPVLFTCNHILNNNELKIGRIIKLIFNQKEISIKLNESRKIYTSDENEYDTTIIELKQDEYNNNDLLEIDDDIYKEGQLDNIYKQSSVYIIHYPNGIEPKYSLDVIKSIDTQNIKIEHFCSTKGGSSGAPIINLDNYKVIGIHLGKFKYKNSNVGVVVKSAIQKFNDKYKNKMGNNINNIKNNLYLIKNNVEINSLSNNHNNNYNNINNNNINNNNYNNINNNNYNNINNNNYNNINNNNINNNNINYNNNNINYNNNNINYNNNYNNNINYNYNINYNNNCNEMLFEVPESNYDKIFPLSGLNIVNLTSSLNSVLQCLFHIPELNYFFINIYPKQKEYFKSINKDVETQGRISEEYYKLVLKIYNNIGKQKNDNSIIPQDFKNLLSIFIPQLESNDSKDLLLYLIQSMHAELNYYGDKKLANVPKCNQENKQQSFNFFMEMNSNLNLSIFSYLFYGILLSNTKCSGCNTTLYNYQNFKFLSFPTFNFHYKYFGIYQGLIEFIKPEIMKGDNQCYCQKCKGLRDAKVTSKIFYPPPYLIINIDYGENFKYKPGKVEFGQIIDLTDFTEKECKEKEYELIAISTYIGRLGNFGHYIAYCYNINNNKWYKFNDSKVNECNFSEVNSNIPYLLIFKKRDI